MPRIIVARRKEVATFNPIVMDIPEAFETERLVMRCPRAGDGAALRDAIWESHESLKRWMPWASHLPSVEDCEQNVREAFGQFVLRQELRLHFFLKESGELAGSTGFHRINWDIGRLEIGYWVRDSLVGQGYVTEAVKGEVEYAATYLSARRLEIRCDPRNDRSWKVAERVGFHREAVLRQDEPDPEGFPSNTYVYALIRQVDGQWGYPDAGGQ